MPSEDGFPPVALKGADAHVGQVTAFGVGPKVAAFSLPAFAVAVILQRRAPEVFLMTRAPSLALEVAGAALIVAGLLLWGAGARIIDRAFHEGRLLTSGPYAIVRHPMYAGWIVLIVPGLALWFHSWALLLACVWASAVFTRLIRVEERYLEEKFGQAYRDYRAKVSALVPFL